LPAWCQRHGRIGMPAEPETVRDYLIDHAGSLTISTLRRRIAALSRRTRSPA
jgi:hypothetical protein